MLAEGELSMIELYLLRRCLNRYPYKCCWSGDQQRRLKPSAFRLKP